LAWRFRGKGLKQLGVWLVLIAAAGCRPKDQNMLVAYVQGDVFLPDLRPCTWNLGAAIDCKIASRTSTHVDEGKDLLLCGATAQLAWSQTWLRNDIKSQLYARSKMFAVTFHSSGHGGGRATDPVWTCKRMPDSIDCE